MVMKCVYPILPSRAGFDTRSLLKRNIAALRSEFSFSWTGCRSKTKEFRSLYNLPIAAGKTHGFIFFLNWFTRRKIGIALSRIWTSVSNSISYENNVYTQLTFIVMKCKMNSHCSFLLVGLCVYQQILILFLIK